jgi:hypothetical protein
MVYIEREKYYFKRKKNMNHDLHFMLNEMTLKKLMKISRAMNIKTISGTIVAIIEFLTPYLEKNQIEFQNRESRYKQIADPDEKRYHIHAYLPEKIYRQLKELHQYLNFYSLAQILREIIEIYLKDFFKNGLKKVVKKYQKVIRMWKMKKVMKKGGEFLRQLSLPDKSSRGISVKYDMNFHPYSIIYFAGKEILRQ